jgi:hypothetical protein
MQNVILKRVMFLLTGMMLHEDVFSAYRYPLRRHTHTFAVSSQLDMSLEVHFYHHPSPTTRPSLLPFFEREMCSNPLAPQLQPLGHSNHSYTLFVKIQSAKHRQRGVPYELLGVWSFENHEAIQRAIDFSFQISLFPLTIHPIEISVYLERQSSTPPLAPEHNLSLPPSHQVVHLLDVETHMHAVSCDLRWATSDSSDASHVPLEVGSVVVLSTNCTVPLGPSDDGVSDKGITFESYVTGSAAFAVNPDLYYQEIVVTATNRVAHLSYTVEVPLLSTGLHILKSKIAYFDGHGSCDVGSSKFSTHFPVSHPLEDYIIQVMPPIHTSHAPDVDLPVCSAKHLYHAMFETPTFGSIETGVYWLHVQTCAKSDLLPRDRQR